MKRKLPDSILLAAGALLLILTHVRFGIGFLGWVVYVPFLLYLRRTEKKSSLLIFFAVYFAAWTLATLKIVTPPVPGIFALPFGFIIALFHFSGFLIWWLFKKKKLAFLIFPAAMILFEWIQYRWTPFSSWGAAAYTQIGNDSLVQSVSLFGMGGLGFMIYLMNALLEETISFGLPKKAAVISTGILLGLMVFGSFRISIGEGQSREMVKVAAIDTALAKGANPAPEEIRAVNMSLLSDIEASASSGVEIAVTTEASTIIFPEMEEEWLASLGALAGEKGIAITAGYAVLIDNDPLLYENKYAMFLADGTLDHIYLKHEPAPGEPVVKGTEPQRVAESADYTLGAAICYDFDYPYLARENARLKADIVALPSSDWRGIDPVHTQMAAFRAVESGFSIIRPTQAGLSALIDPYGKLISKGSSFDDGGRIVIGEIPRNRVWTLYSVTGDLLVYLGVLMIIIIAVYTGKREKKH